MEGSKMVLFRILMMMLALLMSARLFVDAQNMKELEHVCNGNRVDFKFDSAAGAAVDYVVRHTSDPGYHKKRTEICCAGIPRRVAWAIGACYGELSKSQCNKCMTQAARLLRGYCTRKATPKYAAGAQIKLQDCRLRWEMYDFNW